MNPIMRSWRIVRTQRQEGPTPVRGDAISTAATGKEWVERVCEPWSIDIDDLVAIHRDLCESTTPNMLALREQMSLEDVIAASIAAGFQNGLALGLTHGSRARWR